MKMRTNKQAAEHSGLPLKLINAVIRQLGDKDQLQDVYHHGPGVGYSGFTYYRETEPFYRRHRVAINELLIAEAEEAEEDPVQMVLNMLNGPAPKPPKRPTEPKAPGPNCNFFRNYSGNEELVVLDEAQIKAYQLVSDLEREWGCNPLVLSHDSVTTPACELDQANADYNLKAEAFIEAFKVWEREEYQKEMEAYKVALARHEDKLSDWRQIIMDRSADQRLIGQAIYGGRLTDAHTTICNALALFALEEVARAVVIDE
jgi:hypothetical protein